MSLLHVTKVAFDHITAVWDHWVLSAPGTLGHEGLPAFTEDSEGLPVTGVQAAGSDGKPGCNDEAADGETGEIQ